MSARRYSVGDTIPEVRTPGTWRIDNTLSDGGIVIAVGLTAYGINRDGDPHGPINYWVPFYGPNGVDEQAPVAGLVTFADGSRYGGAR